MRFIFDERKAAQAASYLLKLHGGSISYMVLIKLLYLADRQALIDRGSPVTGDRMVSMPHGPVLSVILDLINMGRPEQGSRPWFEHVSEPSDHSVTLLKEPTEFDELSRYELELLKRIHDQFGLMNRWRLRDLTHTLPEWEDPQGSSVSISPEAILRAAGKSPEEVERISQESEEIWFFSTLERSIP